MYNHNDGGPAFPVVADADAQNDAWGGMSLLEYFMAHAPVEPQPWFQPAMPPEPPTVNLPSDMTPEEKREYQGWDEFLATKDLKCPRIRAYAEAVDASHALRREWNRDFEKQRYVQWPRAWAMEMLKERAR
jgi:hypothetical protein